MNEECLIIRDLIPDCAQGLVSGSSRQAIEEHIPNCRKCARKWLVVSKGNPFPEPAAPAVIEERLRKAGKAYRNRRAVRCLYRFMLSIAVLVTLLFFFSRTSLAEDIVNWYRYNNNNPYMYASAESVPETTPDTDSSAVLSADPDMLTEGGAAVK